MNPILLVIPFHAGNAAQTETLVDYIFHLSGATGQGCALPVAASDVHAEPRERIKISCGLAFDHFEMIQMQKFTGDKPAQIEHAFKVVSQFIAQNYRLPWLWLEPDCTPLLKSWQNILLEAYDDQQKLLLKGDHPRIGIYPADFALRTVGTNAVQKTNLIVNQVISRAEEFKRPMGAVLLHGDKPQAVLKQIRAGLK